MDVSNYINGVIVNISGKTQPNSISPSVVGNAFIDLANMTKQNVESGVTLVNNLSGVVSGNTSNISNLSGVTKAIQTGLTATNVTVSANTSAIASIQSGLTSYLKLDSANNLNLSASTVNGKTLSVGNIELSEISGFDEAFVDANGYMLYYIKDGVRYPKVTGTTISTGATGINNNYPKFAQKAVNAQPISISLYGSSISHSENGQGGLTNPTLAQSLQTILTKAGLNASVTNNGVGGADTNYTLAQVNGDTNVFDVAFIEDGGNDRTNGVPLATFKANLILMIKTLIARGSWVILWGCVETNQNGVNENREYYRNAMLEVAREMNCPYFDPSIQNQYLGMRWGDGVVHYNNPAAYAEIAVAMSHYFLYRGQTAHRTYVGDSIQPLYLAMSNPTQGNFQTNYSPNGYTQMIPLSGSGIAYMTFHVEQRCQMYIKLVDGDNVAKQLTVTYGSGGIQADKVFDVTLNTGTNPPIPVKYQLFTLEKGWKTIFFQTTSSANNSGVFWSEIGFEAIA